MAAVRTAALVAPKAFLMKSINGLMSSLMTKREGGREEIC